MKTEVVSITHTNEGIRVCWPDSTTSVFANPIYLAESYVTAMRAKENARKQLVENVSAAIADLEKALDDEAKPTSELAGVRESVIDAARMLA